MGGNHGDNMSPILSLNQGVGSAFKPSDHGERGQNRNNMVAIRVCFQCSARQEQRIGLVTCVIAENEDMKRPS